MFDPIFRFFGYERRDARLTEWSPALAAIFGVSPTAAGAVVTPETALRSPTTLACCRVIAETIASLPVHLYERGTDGSRKRDTTHPAAVLLAGDWAPWSGGVEMRTALMFDALLHGAGYAEVLRAGGKPKELHRLDPRATTIDTTGSEPVFKTGSKGQERKIDWRDTLYLPTPGSAPGRPLCLINLCREAIGLDLIMGEHQARIFSNGARPSGLLKMGAGKLSPERVKELRESWSQLYAGGTASGKTAVLEDGWDFKQLQFTSVDLQFIELRKFAIGDISRAFKVPGTLVGDLDRATWRNVEELARQFLTYTLLPWLEIWQAGLSRVLLSPVERQNMFLEFVVDDLLRADIVNRFAAYRNAAGGAWLTPNEVRGLENRSPVDGGDELIRQAGQGAPAEDPAENPPKPIRAVA